MMCVSRLVLLAGLLLCLGVQLSEAQHWSHGWYPGGKRELESEVSEEIKLCEAGECSYLRPQHRGTLRNIFGKKHIHRVQHYLQCKRAQGDVIEVSGGLKKDVESDQLMFCDLCNMAFCTPGTAQTHYKGRPHIHKQQVLSRQKQAFSQPGMDPDSCALCSVTFKNPNMALQHYSCRKHRRNLSRQKMLQDLREDAQKASCLTCQMCNAKFESVEMYQAHMQGSKHHIKAKKVINLCKSQQKNSQPAPQRISRSFTDELADYIQVQKARGVSTPAALQGSPQKKQGEGKDSADPRNNHREYLVNRPPVTAPTTTPLPPPNPPLSGPSYPRADSRCPPRPPYGPGPPTHTLYHHHHYRGGGGGRGMPRGWGYPLPHPAFYPGPGAPYHLNPQRPGPRKREHSEQSSSSSFSSSSSSTSSSSYSSDSEAEEKRRRHRSGRESGVRERDSDQEAARAQRRKRARHDHSQERRRGGEEGGDSHTERSRRKGHRDPTRRRRQEKRPEEGKEAEEVAVKDLKQTQVGLAEAHPEAHQAHSAKPRPRKEKEKKKPRETEHDKRTEEEKLWDESIMGLS
ncbi:hypothetical protein NHX12_029852 [Muraenolepis orangiensis]|uniref:C2H2-type domain-containing protein n=1 Tax=Muraenolepis orangiensis TaxID=630683 RepID=A0A9Q0E930_9TELE|nr:hypothetical protein NHX12_029852 [Muraenolepis orangiensis]